MILWFWSSTPGNEAWRADAERELTNASKELTAAADQAREVEGETDNELAILAEEVIDLATRALVVRLRVSVAAAEEETEAGSSELRMLMGMEPTEGWPLFAISRLQASIAPLGKAIQLLTPHTKESVDELTVLREEVLDVAARLVAANARVRTESSG